MLSVLGSNSVSGEWGSVLTVRGDRGHPRAEVGGTLLGTLLRVAPYFEQLLPDPKSDS